MSSPSLPPHSADPKPPPPPSVPGGTPADPAHRQLSPAQDQQLGLDAGVLVVRVVVGLIMAGHGTQKLFRWFDGGGLNSTSDFFAAEGYKAAKTMAYVAALTETFCGLGLAIGLLTPLAAAGVLGVMINAMAITWGDGFFLPEGIEYQVVLASGAVAVALTGPGRLAADQLLPGLRDHRFARGVAAVALGVISAAFVLLVLRD
ncbi:DoxX family protein [Streptomyces silvensis]|uniref:DoxX family protein n=1 Tax=Streptomyces silvensis TaxID=1765722 RepID=A0A0W7X937_9ACTN|nr:DoxX family protein [Streptomyces silvensis]KUF19027.1 DoxX family protein [Streptomyces silvensis]